MLRMLAPTTLANFVFETAKDILLAALAAWLTVKRVLREFSSKEALRRPLISDEDI